MAVFFLFLTKGNLNLVEESVQGGPSTDGVPNFKALLISSPNAEEEMWEHHALLGFWKD